MENVIFLEGKRVILRPINKETDAVTCQRWINDPEVCRFIGRGAFPISLDEEKSWFDLKPEKFPQKVLLAMVLKKTGKLIGSFGIHDINWIDRSASTGSLIGERRYRGQGYGTEAKELILRYLFQTLGLNRVESKVLAYNRASLRYAEKCGYRKEGVLRQAIYKNGQFHDLVVFSILREEWLKQQKTLHKSKR